MLSQHYKTNVLNNIFILKYTPERYKTLPLKLPEKQTHFIIRWITFCHKIPGGIIFVTLII